ncbi:molybdopterin synthase subunit MoaD2 [Isoptericola hypogeus]|uniref:Molybdopterin synthase subunit MoaD2 n=1 Tax=Isoptericola hypogeus TaxID=300179 RepID=A0ABN2IPF4_9MICO
MTDTTTGVPTDAVVELRYFAAARAALGRTAETLSLDAGATVADVVARLADGTPSAAPVLARCSVLLDGRRAAPSEVVPAGARLDLLPPFAGG